MGAYDVCSACNTMIVDIRGVRHCACPSGTPLPKCEREGCDRPCTNASYRYCDVHWREYQDVRIAEMRAFEAKQATKGAPLTLEALRAEIPGIAEAVAERLAPDAERIRKELVALCVELAKDVLKERETLAAAEAVVEAARALVDAPGYSPALDDNHRVTWKPLREALAAYDTTRRGK